MIILFGGNAHGCDSIITLHLTINQPSVHEITVITYNPYFWMLPKKHIVQADSILTPTTGVLLTVVIVRSYLI